MWVWPIVNAPASRILGAYDLRVATPRAVLHASNKTSGDARSCTATEFSSNLRAHKHYCRRFRVSFSGEENDREDCMDPYVGI
uniref:Uncharacterized protein n=1 Tax=Tanacetum cinerariifolium TaxID=118510 RepID=A0A699K2G6_TANCI|nr:hypothetical protein [Tanacetum cinerariifolium]